MKIKEYFKDKFLFLIVNLIIFITISVILHLGKVGSLIIFLVGCIWFFPITFYIILDFFKSKKYYDNIISVLDGLDRKYLLPELIDEPNFYNGEFLYEVLKETDKDMHEHVKTYKMKEKEYREYIETWVHEIKTPISSINLILENNESEITFSIKREIKKIEEYIDQVLYYARSNDVSKDYLIREFSLEKSIKNVVKRNSRDFINKRISLELGDLNYLAYSDEKWVEFIIGQILNNAIKYTKVGGKISISSFKNKNSITLTIKDNGVGIAKKDLGRVFEKGFTGDNGRKFSKSTGIGLYLCKKLCDKLGIGLKLYSKENNGTEVNLIFPIGNALLAK